MPCHDKTGPQGTGQPGKGNGPCHTEHNHNQESHHGHSHGHHHGCNCGCHAQSNHQDKIYAYTAEELNNRKQALQKEMQWLEERINEIGEKHEDSNPVN